MERLARRFDWSSTPRGPAAGWSATLRTAVRLMMGSRYPMFVWWGDELVNLYNDAYIPLMGQRHPEGFGMRASEVWAGFAWAQFGPAARAILKGGPPTWHERKLMVLERNGYAEECYFTVSHSAIAQEDGSVGGIFGACTEETRTVLLERRMKTLRDVADAPAVADGQAQCQWAAQALG